jgi:hypothetical protein
MFGSIKVRFKAQQIVAALPPPRKEAISAVSDILDAMGFATERLRNSQLADRLLRVNQLFDQVQICKINPNYLGKGSLDDFSFLVCTLISCNDQQILLGLIKEVASHSHDPSVRQIYIAEKILRAGDIPVDHETSRIAKTAIELLSLNTMQVVALAFNDRDTVMWLQAKKVVLHEGLLQPMN